MWTLSEAIPIIQELEAVIRVKYNCFTALTGSVLHKGQSDKDLDILILPLTAQNYDYNQVIAYLEGKFNAKLLEPTQGNEYSREVIRGTTVDNKRIEFILIAEVQGKN